MIPLNIDGRDIETKKGRTVLEAALEAGIYIPHLCHHPDLTPVGGCGLCVVEIEGMEGLLTSCTTPAEEGMYVKTKSPHVDRMRRLAMELLLSGHPPDCTVCSQYLNCELQSMKQYIGTAEELHVRRRSKPFAADVTNPLFIHDPARCILCGRCMRACHDLREVGVLSFAKKGREAYIGTGSNRSLADAGCRFCGACVEVCPTGALRDKEELTRGRSRRAARVPCRYTCPAEIDIPRYIRLIREEKYSEATAVIREKVPFPKVLGYVCNHPCEAVCRRGEVNEEISIKELKRFAAERDHSKLWKKNSRRADPTGKRVAIIGSGPAGLTAAYYLSRSGHEVTVFEALPFAGGMIRIGIPEYRVPRDVLEEEIHEIESTGVEIKTNSRVDSLDTLFEEGYHAILVAVGTHEAQKLPIPGADQGGVLVSMDFLKDVNLGKKVKVGEKVLVLGGGNVAFDCARVARRLGADEVHLVCLESRHKMVATPEEILQGEEEGVVLHPSRTFTRILTNDGRIMGVECLNVDSFEFDEEGKAQISAIEGSEHLLPADTIIFAIGQRPQIPPSFELVTGKGNRIEVDSYTFQTSREGVYAAGDAVTGTTSVIEAIASGRTAAAALDRYLGGSGDIDKALAPVETPETRLGRREGFARESRFESSRLPPEERVTGFCSIVHDLGQKAAVSESHRCLQCDLRLKMTPVKFWGDY
ncbi:MAG TPA: FAD-dependent oxidoreductase [Thermodesulfobacteriota bacterium]|nr:FAD-dependent oxidoreductase [Thermodesulfobacteriota bacterium]